MTKYLLGAIMVLTLSGCLQSVELGAQLYKSCVLRSQDNCPTDRISEWIKEV